MIDINLKELESDLQECNNEKKVTEIRNIFLKKYVTPLYAELKVTEDKKVLGQQINDLKANIDKIVNDKLESLNDLEDPDYKLDLDPYIDAHVYQVGTRHLLNTVADDISQYLDMFSFQSVSGNEITSNEYNFDALNIDKNHPARESHDSLFINSQYLLRTHCTSVSSVYLQKHQARNDIRVYSIGNVYRRDEDDATHSHQFTQVDFVWVRADLSLSHLKYIINGLIRYLFGQDLDVRYRLSYFPFTEPSFEVDVECWKCRKNGCSLCKQSGWIEILGAGMLNQKVLKYAGITDIKNGIAAGMGIERVAMLKYGISDIRDLYNNDFDVNKQFRR